MASTTAHVPEKLPYTSLGLSSQSNRLTKIEGLQSLVNLRELYLSHNGIEVIEGLENNVSPVSGLGSPTPSVQPAGTIRAREDTAQEASAAAHLVLGATGQSGWKWACLSWPHHR